MTNFAVQNAANSIIFTDILLSVVFAKHTLYQSPDIVIVKINAQ